MVLRTPACLTRGSLAAAFVALAALASPAAAAATLYKLIDANGKVTYAASAPTAFNGKVIPMELDSGSQKGIMPEGLSKPEPDGKDYLSQRRARWAEVEAKLRKARDWLEEAKLNLANATMAEDEVQWVAKTTSSPSDSRACTPVMRNGRLVRACAKAVGNQKFIDKMDYLESQVRDAEAAVAAAEIGYRRGMD